VTETFAARAGGRCPHCQAKRSQTDPFYQLYLSLSSKVRASSDGFGSLSEAEALYFVVTLFQNEVYNGGFHQFFLNSSGSYCDLIERGLVTFDEPRVLQLLQCAKEIAFPGPDVPKDIVTRRKQIPYAEPGSPMPEWAQKLYDIDLQYNAIPDTLSPKLKAFAREKGLVSA
jgi:hypothetical protein